MSENKSAKYWENRIANNTWDTYNSVEEKNRALLDFYDDAVADLKEELYGLAEKYSKNGTLTLSDMHKKNRLSNLQKKYENIIKSLGKKTEEFTKNNMFHSFEEVYANASASIEAVDFAMPNQKLMEELLQKPWRGNDFSSRLWENQQKVSVALNNQLLLGLQQGKTTTEMAINIGNFMNRSFNVAHTLVRTETMHYLNQASLQSYKDAGIGYVQIWAAEDERTCVECGQYHERIYEISKCPILPFHPNCRCTVIPYFNKITAANAIESKKFKDVYYDDKNSYYIKLDSFERCVNAGLSDACRNVAKLGSQDRCEHLNLVNLSSGKLDFYETNNSPNEVGIEFWNYIDEHIADKFAFVHNHNTNTSFSESDLRTMLTTENVPVMVAARNDGVIYLLERKGDKLKSGWFDELYQVDMEELNKLSRQGIITGDERSMRREMMIVENLIRDYTKGLVKVDGRK